LDILIKLEDKLSIALAKHGLGTVAAVQNNFAEAEQLLNESLALFRGLGDKGGTAWLIQEFGHMKIRQYLKSKEPVSSSQLQDDYKQLMLLLCEGVTLAQELGHIVTAAFCILGLAGLTGLAGQCERAARLWGAAEVLRLESQGLMSENDKLSYAEDENWIRNIFNPDLYQTAHNEGRAMTRHQAETFALEVFEHF
jgi:hypothetical protein